MKNSKRVWFVGLIIFLLGAGIADYVLWQRTESQLSASYRDFCDRLRVAGFSVGTEQPKRGGWPFAASLTAPDFQATGANGLSWRSEQIVASVSLFTPWEITVDLRGPHRLSAPDLPPLTLQARSLTVNVPFVIGQSASLSGRDITIGMDGKPFASIAELTGTAIRQQAELALSARAEILEWALDNKLTQALGPRLSSVSTDASLTLLPSLGGSDMLGEWRERNGRLSVHRMAFGWGPLGFDGDFTVMLDEKMQPVVDGTAKILGYPATLAAFANTGLITGNSAMAARAALGLLSDASDGSSPRVTLPFSVQNGIVSLAGFPLFRLQK